LLVINQVNYELIDVASSEKALQHMKRQNNNGNSDGRAKEVPQVFVGGEYRGVCLMFHYIPFEFVTNAFLCSPV
jgi:glutaredoxin